jgi:hypothetical protein
MRIGAAVQVGGVKVFPFYVAGPGLEALLDGLLDWCAERLATPERPAALGFGERLPRLASGKPADWIIDLA